MSTSPLLTRRQRRELEQAERVFVPIVTGSTPVVSAAQDAPAAIVIAKEASASPNVKPAAAPVVVVAPVVAKSPASRRRRAAANASDSAAASYARLLDSIESDVPLTRAEARRRRESAALDTMAIDISTVFADSVMIAAATPTAFAAAAVSTASRASVLPESTVAIAAVPELTVARSAAVSAPVVEAVAKTEPIADVTPVDVSPAVVGDLAATATSLPDALRDASSAADEALPAAAVESVLTESVPAAKLPTAALPHSSRTLAASTVNAARSAKPAQARRPASARRVAAKVFSGAVMTVVTLMAVATSLPADALLTSDDVQAAQQLELQNTAPGIDEPVQSVEVAAGTDSVTIARDGYETSTVAQVAVASGIRMESSFTNNPNGTVQWPFAVGVHIGDQFGYRDCAGCSSNHGGQDFNPGDGAPIQAIADGVVVLAEDGEGSLGVHMIIEHVINGATVASVYAHMQHGTMLFAEGDVVKVGQILGNTGSTGMSTGPHLHFEIREGGMNGTKVDPLQWLYANVN